MSAYHADRAKSCSQSVSPQDGTRRFGMADAWHPPAAQKMKEAVAAAGLQSVIAEKCEIGRVALSAILNGRSAPRLRTFILLCKATGTRPAEIIGEDAAAQLGLLRLLGIQPRATIDDTRNAEPLDFSSYKAKRPAEQAPVFVGTVTTEERIVHVPDPDAATGPRERRYETTEATPDLIEVEEETVIARMILDPELVAIARRFEWVMSNRVVPALIGLALAIFSQGLWS